MKIYLDEEELALADSFFDESYENEGSEAFVYRYKDKALKIYKDYCRKDRLDLDTTKKLCGIKTKRILLPDQVVLDENKKFLGYTTRFLQRFSFSQIGNMKMDKFLEELELFGEDINILSLEHISLEDMNQDNTIYSDGLYLCDPGSYKVEEDYPERYMRLDNQQLFNAYVRDELLKGSCKLTKKEKNNLTSFLPDDDYDICEVIRDEVKENETVKKFTKRVSK